MCAFRPQRLLELIRAAFEYPTELQAVRHRLVQEFDVKSLREHLSAERCWTLMTAHIDKLESLQVVLHSAVQRAEEMKMKAAAFPLDCDEVLRRAVICLSDHAGDGTSVADTADVAALRHEIEELQATQVYLRSQLHPPARSPPT